MLTERSDARGCMCLALAIPSWTLPVEQICEILMRIWVQWRGALTFLFQLWVTSTSPQDLGLLLVPPVT